MESATSMHPAGGLANSMLFPATWGALSPFGYSLTNTLPQYCCCVSNARQHEATACCRRRWDGRSPPCSSRRGRAGCLSGEWTVAPYT